jgi:dolichol-phosphate mannosyltransferase
MSSVDLSVIIPVYNNAATLGELLDRLVAVLDPMPLRFEIVLVDDGSRDHSLSILQARAASDPRLRVFALVRNFGSQAAACAALDLARGRRMISMDADLENCPEDIPVFLEQLDRGHDLVCGYRPVRSAPWLTRRLPSHLLNLYVRRQTGVRIRDLGCGMKAFEASVVRDLAAEGEARRLLPPLVCRRARAIAEVPIRPGAERQAGGHSFLTLLGIAVDYYLVTARRPFLIAGLVAAAGTGAGILLLTAGAAAAGLVLSSAGLLGILLSLVGEYCQRLYQLSQGLPFYKLRDLDEAQPPSACDQPALPRGQDTRPAPPATPPRPV